MAPGRLSRRMRLRLVALGLLLLAAVWAVGIEPRWVARRDISHAVSAWQGPPGLKVAVAADWHISRQPFWRVMTADRARAIVQEINTAAPDLVLLPGDLIASRNDDADTGRPEDEIAEVLGGLRAPLGVYAVLGNHDWWHDGAAMAAALRRRGIVVLENEAVPLKGTALWVVGIGDDFTGHSQPGKAIAGLPPDAHALVLMHDPASLLELPPLSGLLVAGHTHGGQVALPFYGALAIPSAAPRQWAYGWVAHGGNRMHVTSGLGVSILPVRFNMRPEWVLFTINGKKEP
jgi:predicted MPP superfamily phosphohydrolase